MIGSVSAVGLLVSLAIVNIAYARWHATRVIDELRAKCERQDQAPAAPFQVGNSLLDLAPREGVDVYEAARLLGERRFEFIEYEFDKLVAGDWRKVPNPQKLKFLRLHVADKGDERCSVFYAFLDDLQIYRSSEIRWLGIPIDKCIAATAVSDSQADTHHLVERSGSSGWMDFRHIAVHQYRDAKSGQVFGSHFVAGYSSCASNGVGCLFDPIGRTFGCGAEYSQMKRFERRVTVPNRPGTSAGSRPREVERLPLAPFPAQLEVTLVAVEAESPQPSVRRNSDRTLDGDAFLSSYAAGDDKFDPRMELPRHGLRVMHAGGRRIVPLADGNKAFFGCQHLIRQGSELAVTCDGWKELNVPGGKRDGPWLLVFAEDGSPKRLIAVNLEALEPRHRNAVAVSGFDVVPGRTGGNWITLLHAGSSDGRIPAIDVRYGASVKAVRP